MHVVESDELGDDWPVVPTYEEAEAYVRGQCDIFARENFCGGGEVGLYGPLAGVPRAEIERDLIDRNLGAIVSK